MARVVSSAINEEKPYSGELAIRVSEHATEDKLVDLIPNLRRRVSDISGELSCFTRPALPIGSPADDLVRKAAVRDVHSGREQNDALWNLGADLVASQHAAGIP
jgi:hypothetical protein